MLPATNQSGKLHDIALGYFLVIQLYQSLGANFSLGGFDCQIVDEALSRKQVESAAPGLGL